MLNNLCRIGMDMPKNRWWQWIAAGLLGLLLLTLLTRCSNIQDDIQARAQATLDAENMSWATVNLQDHGRDALLSGEAPSQTEKDKAIETVQNLYGVRTVDNDITLKQYVSSTLDLKWVNDKVKVSGTLPDQATVDATIAQVRHAYGTDKVSQQLVVDDAARKPEWLAGIAGLLPTLVATRNLTLSANDEVIQVSGDVETAELRDAHLSLMSTTLSDKLTAAIEVVKTGPTEEELAAIAAEEARKAAAAEAARNAEKARLAAQAEAARAAEAEKARLAAARKAEAKARLAAIAQQKATAAEKARRTAEAQVAAKQRQMMAMHMHHMRMANRRKVIIVQPMLPIKHNAATVDMLTQQQDKQRVHMLTQCEQALNRLVNNNPAPFAADSAEIQQNGYILFKQLMMQIRYCGRLIQQTAAKISVAAPSGSKALSQQRAQTAIDQLQQHSGIPAERLNITPTPGNPSGDAQLNFTLTQ